MYSSFSLSPPSASSSTTPMDIPAASRTRTQSPSCAYPSWPRRSSLSSSDSASGYEDQALVSSYISDDDLLFPCVFDEAECTPLATPHANRSPTCTSETPEAQVVVDTGALMRKLIAEEKAKRKRRGSRSLRKSRSGSSGKQMSPIQEIGE